MPGYNVGRLCYNCPLSVVGDSLSCYECFLSYFYLPPHPRVRVATRFHTLNYSGTMILAAGCHNPCFVFLLNELIRPIGSFYPGLHFAFSAIPACGFFMSCRYQFSVSGELLEGRSNPDSGAAYIVLTPECAKPTHRGARTVSLSGSASQLYSSLAA